MLLENASRAIVLNADHRPLSLAPPSTIHWHDAVKSVLSGAVYVVAEHDRVVTSEKVSMRLPSVVALTRYYHVEARKAPLSRWNLFLSYGFRCAFCTGEFDSCDLTFDHLIPRARGGTSTWGNLLPACAPCNHAKGCRTPAQAGMPVAFDPIQPTIGHLNRMSVTCADRHPFPDAFWQDILYWTVKLVP